MRMQQEQWINEVMSSIKGIQKAPGNPYLHTRVLARLGQSNAVQKEVPRLLYAMAAVAIIIVMMNGFLWIEQDAVLPEANTTSTTVVSEYDLTSIDY
jgi:hypothetical protein